MAEGGNRSAPSARDFSDDSSRGGPRYFCHSCGVIVSDVGESFTCPRCSQGFLEEVDDANSEEIGAGGGRMDDNAEEFLHEFVGALLMGQQQQQPRAQGQDNNAQNPFTPFLRNLLEGLVGGAGSGGFQIRVQMGGQDNPSGGGAFFMPFGGLHGNLGDYAWGPGGLDAVVTQLLNQIEGGAPPMDRETICRLPIVEVTQEQADKRLQCTTCMEELKKGEAVRELPCKHCFHDDCIIPWLERHNTCPICRKVVEVSESAPQSSATQRTMDAIDELD